MHWRKSFPPRPSLELREISEPSPDEREPGLLFFAMVIAPLLVVLSILVFVRL
jgi:hypothetical protein